MATAPAYAATPKSSTVALATANANRDGTTGVYGTIHTAGASGARIDVLNLTATVATTAGMIRLFVSNKLIREVPVAAVTPSATVPAWSEDVVFDPPLILGAAVALTGGNEKSENVNATIVNGGDF